MSRPFPLVFVLGGCAFATLAACPSRTGGPASINVPPGCEQPQAGEYHHVGNPAFRYLGEDDGRTLTLTLVRARRDGGVGEAPDAGAITLALTRTPDGFVGQTQATGFSVAGMPCPVKFPTEITACSASTLTLRSVASTSLDEACRPPPSGPAPKWTEQVLRRGAPPPPVTGASTPDAGVGAADGGRAGG